MHNRHILPSLALFAVATAFLPAPLSAGEGVWTYNGPDGGFVRHLIAHSSSSGTAFTFEDGGLFRTTDAGLTWTRIETGLPPGLFRSALGVASSGNVLYFVVGNEVYRSSNNGNTWAATPSAPAGLIFAKSIEVATDDSDKVVIAAGNRVWTTANAGATWFAAPALAESVDFSRVVFGSGGALIGALSFPSSAYPAVGGVDVVLLRSTDGGLNFAPGGRVSGLFSGQVMKRSPIDPQRLFVGGSSAGSIFTSGDGGVTVSAASLPAGCTGMLDVAPLPSTATGAAITCRGSGGMAFSNNATIASPAWTSRSAAAGLVNFGTEPALSNLIAVDADYPAPARFYAAIGSGILSSNNNGLTWSRSDAGIQEQRVRAIAIHPSDNRVTLVGMSDGGENGLPIYKSTNSAATFVPSSAGTTADWIRTLAIDAASTDASPVTFEPFTVYAAGLSQPPPTGFARDASIMKSTDGGVNWAPINNGIPTQTSGGLTFTNMGTVRSIVLDPRSCAAPPPAPAVCAPGSGSVQKLWVGGTGRFNFSTGGLIASRVYRSSDAGLNWVASDAGVSTSIFVDGRLRESTFVVPMIINPNNPLILYLGTGVSNFTDPPVDPTIDNGVYKSIDGGVTWSHSSNGLPRFGGPTTSHLSVLALAISPINPNVLFASVNDIINFMPVASIYKSIDGGANWVNASTGIGGADVRALLIDPADATGNTVYAGLGGGNAANPGAVYRSIDGGLNWNSYSLGLPSSSALSLALANRAPGEQARLLAGTSAGLWEFTVPIDGDSDAVGTEMENSVNGGDGDGDGFPDAAQADAASFSGETGGNATRGPAVEGTAASVPITLDIVSGCAQLNNATRYDASQYPLDTQHAGIDHSQYGLIRVELPNCTNAVVDVTFHGANFNPLQWAWRNYGPRVPGDETTFAWYAFAGAQLISANTWRLTLDVNAQGNYRNDGDNILLLGGPAAFAQALFGNGFEQE